MTSRQFGFVVDKSERVVTPVSSFVKNFEDLTADGRELKFSGT